MLKIYLDNCCYNRPFDDLSQQKVNNEALAKLYVQSLIKDNMLMLCYSYMSIAEILDCNIEYNKITNFEFINKVKTDYIAYDKLTINELANDAIKTGVKEKDANHVACAIKGNCDFLLTTDKRLLKYKTDKLVILNPIDFVKIWEKLIYV